MLQNLLEAEKLLGKAKDLVNDVGGEDARGHMQLALRQSEKRIRELEAENRSLREGYLDTAALNLDNVQHSVIRHDGLTDEQVEWVGDTSHSRPHFPSRNLIEQLYISVRGGSSSDIQNKWHIMF